MEVVYKSCCGMDIHKDIVVACCVADGVGREVRSFGTMTDDLLELCGWLKGRGVEMVAMESTASYWKPIFNMLEVEGVPCMLVNARHVKNVPGRKTDVKDSEWIADLLRHGLLKASFVQRREDRETKELVRYKEKLVEERAREYNRMDKVLQGANIKLSSVASRMNTESAMDMCRAIARGEATPEALAALARGTMKGKAEELKRALKGLIQPHQRMMLTSMLDHIDYLDGQISALGEEIDLRMAGHEELVAALDAIPGVGRDSAQAFIAEAGTDMSVFPTAGHFLSWSGTTPENNESAGKKGKAKARKGNSQLKKRAVQCAVAAAKRKNTYLGSMYKRIAARRGAKVARVAVARTILEIYYYMVRDGTSYKDLGEDHFVKQNRDGIMRRSRKRIEALGFKVTVEDPGSPEAPAGPTL